jgi:cation:H+ antiporter
VVGSNILNVLLILGLAALITPLVVAQQLIRLDVPLMIAASLLVYALAWDGAIGRLDGVLLACGIVVYTVFAIVKSRRESAEIAAEYAAEFGSARAGGVWKNFGLVIVGLALLALGARWLVEAAVMIARHFGLGELIVGLTVVAAGTSLPEVVASVIASLRGERDIAVGNVVGSNLFNLMAVLGIASVVSASGVPVSPSALRFDLPVMIAVAVACLPIFFTGHRIARWEGALFLAYYVVYTTYLILYAVEHDALPAVSAALLWFVLPLTAVTLIVLAARAWRAGSAASGR